VSAPQRVFKSWYLRMKCGKCGRERYLAETHMTIAGKGNIVIRDLIPRLRHDQRLSKGQVRSGRIWRRFERRRDPEGPEHSDNSQLVEGALQFRRLCLDQPRIDPASLRLCA
jgi:hypothetical protein